MRTVTTRIMQADTDTYSVYRSGTTQSERVGTKNEYTLYGSITGQLSPVRDSTLLEIYGNRVEQMFNLTFSKGVDLKLNDKIAINGDYYKVIAVLPYTSHCQATIERIGVINGST